MLQLLRVDRLSVIISVINYTYSFPVTNCENICHVKGKF